MTLYTYISPICAGVLLLCLAFVIPKTVRYTSAIKRYKVIPHSDEKTNFAIIIPARNESRVIEANLQSVFASDYPADKYEVFVIVENENDPTVEICKKYDRVNVFYRTNLENEGKGYALDECIKDIFEKHDRFDAFVIFDADNLVGSKFLSRMSDAYMAGYDAACGNRNNKDWNASVTCASSALTFIAINSVQNKMKSCDGMNMTFSGTGFFIRSDILKNLGGWPFHSLTEDYEFSTYAMCKRLKTYYVDDALYYDEHPVKLSQSIVQRTRWVKGYFTVRKRYKKQKKEMLRACRRDGLAKKDALGELPLLALAIDIVLYVIFLIVMGVLSLVSNAQSALFFFSQAVAWLFFIYLVIVIVTVFLFKLEERNIHITKSKKLGAILFHPIFLATYVAAAIRAIFIKSKWEIIEHTINTEISDEEN